MTVFRGYVLIIRRNIWTILMYILIFIGVTLMIQQEYKKVQEQIAFTSITTDVAVVNRDDGILGETIRKFLEREQNLVDIEDDEQVLQEELYYKNVEYILVVPEGTQEKMEAEATRVSDADFTDLVESISVPGSTTTYYVDAQISALLNQIRLYLVSGYSLEDSCSAALQLGEKRASVTLLDDNGNGGMREDYNYYFGYMPYAFLGGAIMAISLIIMEFKKKEIRRRMESSSATFLAQNISAFASCIVAGVIIWGICMIFHVIHYQGGAFKDPNAILYIVNSICCLLVALSLGYLTGMVAKGPATLNGMNNVFSLGLCFLGGVMVPLSMLSDGVKKVAQFLPTYWYSTINGILGDFRDLSDAHMETIYQGYGIQLLFALACLGIALLIRRMRQQERG